MADLTDTILETLIAETTQSLPAELLSFYRNPPGRKPQQYSLRIREALEGMSDDAAIEIIRAIVDATVFSTLYLAASDFRGKGIEITAALDGDRVRLSGSGLHERYRAKIMPGGLRQDQD